MTGPDPRHWLHRLTADEWLHAAMKELSTARASFERHAIRPALASARRAAGMGWNAVMALEQDPDPRFGRSYADHLRALADVADVADVSRITDPSSIPIEVCEAAKHLMQDPAASKSPVVQILTPKRDARLIEAAETIVAEAYTRVLRKKGKGS